MNKTTSMKPLIFLLTLFFSSLAYSQQAYFSNPSFEAYNALPEDIAEGKRCLKNWTIPVVKGNGDYYHSKAKGRKANVNKNYFGKQKPHSGEAYAGICITDKFREFLQSELTSPLEKGKKYRVEVYVSRGDKSWLSYVDEFGIIFTDQSIRLPDNDVMISSPSIVFTQDAGYKNDKEWIKLSAVYVADGTETHLTFGSFLYRADGELKGDIHGMFRYAHYFVDDFSIREIIEE